jgi:flagellar protein FliS
MSHTAHEAYLETQVLTATPQKLRLMLIDGAIRFARQALDCWDDADQVSGRIEALARCNEIVSELYSSIRVDASPVAEKVQDLYRFLLLQLAKVTQHYDASTLRDVLGVLESERETWRQLCEQMPERPAGHAAESGGSSEVTAAGMSAIPPQVPGTSTTAGSAGSLSLEA